MEVGVSVDPVVMITSARDRHDSCVPGPLPGGYRSGTIQAEFEDVAA